MAHEIEGNKAFYVSTPAWHKLGKVLTDAPTIEEAWNLAYPHTLFKLDIDAKIVDESGNAQYMPLKNSKVIMRDDGLELSTVGSDFELVQPIEILEYFRPLLESGLVKLEAGGSLRGGSQMWALAKVQNADADILPGDKVEGYELFYTGFDGNLRAGKLSTNTRVVCANTLKASLNDGKHQTKFKHTKNIRIRMQNAQDAVKQRLENFQKDVEKYRFLAAKKVSELSQKVYVRNVFLTDSEKQDPKTISTKKENTIQHVINLIDTQKNLELVPAMRGTAWQAYNAVTQYLTHDYGRSDDSRVQSQWFGETSRINSDALNLAMSM